MSRLLIFCCSLFCLLFPAIGTTFELEPLAVRNLSPVATLIGLPTLEPARVLEKGNWQWQIALDAASHFTHRSNDHAAVIFDGETWHSALTLKKGLSRNLEMGLTIPVIRHSGGFLDGFIENWHDLFGLPQNGRDNAPRNRLMFKYSDTLGRNLTRTSSSGGLGDIALQAGWQWLPPHKGRSLALRGQLKLPTGRSEDLTGSGGWDAALWLSGEQRWRDESGPWVLYGGSGVLLSETGDLLPALRRNLAGIFTFGAGWQPLPHLGLQLQFDGHSPLYRGTGLRELDSFAGQLSMGGQLALGPRTTLELAVVEDILVDTAPDVVLHLGLRRHF